MEVTSSRPLDEVVRITVIGFIEKEAQRIADEYKEKALKDLEVAVRKAVTETAVTFSRMIDVKDGGDHITIHVSDRRGDKK